MSCLINYIPSSRRCMIRLDRLELSMTSIACLQVAPAELEAILLSHPSVDDAAVFALPDEEAGEIPAACVVMCPKAEDSEAAIMKYVASNVATYKRIRVLHFVDSIPKSSSGKILRRLLRENVTKKSISTLSQEKGIPR